MATKITCKRRIQKVLSENSTGIFSDNSWEKVHSIWAAVRAIGADLVIESAEYGHNVDGVPIQKKWLYTVTLEGYTFTGVLTAHGAGSIKDPLDKYDISAYIC